MTRCGSGVVVVVVVVVVLGVLQEILSYCCIAPINFNLFTTISTILILTANIEHNLCSKCIQTVQVITRPFVKDHNTLWIDCAYQTNFKKRFNKLLDALSSINSEHFNVKHLRGHFVLLVFFYASNSTLKANTRLLIIHDESDLLTHVPLISLVHVFLTRRKRFRAPMKTDIASKITAINNLHSLLIIIIADQV